MNHYAQYTWESLSQNIINKYCREDDLPNTARHKFIHLDQAQKILGMSKEEIYKEGYRDFLVIRTNEYYYMDDKAHLDGIIHPKGFLTHLAKVKTEKIRKKLLLELAKTGIPSELEEGLIGAIFDDPEEYHSRVRKASRNAKGQRRLLDAESLPKCPYNGFQLRQMKCWIEEHEIDWNKKGAPK